MPFFKRVPPTPSAGGGVASDYEHVYWTVDLSAVAYGRRSYTSQLRYPSDGMTHSAGESSRYTSTTTTPSTGTLTAVADPPIPQPAYHSGAPHIVAGSLAYTYPHSDHPGCPNALTCLQDSDERPGYTLRTVITCTILGSPQQRLTLRDIFLYVKAKYPYFKAQSKTFEVRAPLLSC